MLVGQRRKVAEFEKAVGTDDAEVDGGVALAEAPNGVVGYFRADAPRVPRGDSEAESHLHTDVDVCAGPQLLE